MGSPVWGDEAALWRAVDGGWERTDLSGVRCEAVREQAPGAAGPELRDALRLYVPIRADVAEGDYALPAASEADEPPADALRVVSVAPWTLGGRFHHLEVTAR